MDLATSPHASGRVAVKVRLIHRSRLRVRLGVVLPRHQPEAADRLCAALRRQAGITRVRLNRHAASVIVEFRHQAAQERLAGTLAELPGFDLTLQGLDAAQDAAEKPASDKNQKNKRRQAAEEDAQGWHVMALEQVLQALRSEAEGLSPVEAAKRLDEEGRNLLTKLERRSDWHILREQFQSAPVAMLGVSAAIALMSAAPVDATVIVIVLGVNGAIGFLTERQAEDTIADLASVEGQSIKVSRGGRIIEISTEEIVTGDILLLEPGTHLPADARLVHAHHLSVDESSLTGESLPVVKRAKDSDTPKVLAERRNMVHLGTTVSGGDGRAVVVETGDDTELGKIQALASENLRPRTPMQEQLDATGTQLAAFSAGICALVFVLGILRGQPRLAMLNTALSLAVAAVPEGLPAISSSLLAMGIRRMGKQNVLARHLDAIENLGAIDVLCVDKTGTPTENRMQVVEVLGPNHSIDCTAPAPDFGLLNALFWKVLALCNEATCTDNQWEGSATESALAQLAFDAGVDVDRLRASMPRQKVRYRSESRPYMVTSHGYPRKAGYFQAVKGRPRQVINRCTHARRNGRRVKLTDKLREEIMKENQRLMGEAYRVLGVAWRHSDDGKVSKIGELEWLGLVAMTDPLRPEVVELLPRLQEAGIRTIILTGDQLGTAAAIGRKAGLNGQGDVRVLGADELEELSEGELLQEVGRTQVFARVSPAMKLKLVQALQRSGHRVAMTGDGVNDGPALRVADVGIAMGRDGSDVARNMSDVLLTDDRLQSILDAIAQGRASFSNLQKAIEYLLSTNFSEIQVALGAIAVGLPTPLSPIQLLWINLITDVFPALAIGFEEPEWDVLKQPPESFARGAFDPDRLGGLLRQSLVITGGTFSSYIYGLLRYGIGPKANTQAFMTLSTAQLLHSLSSRSRSSSLRNPRGPGPNRLLKATVGGSLAMQVAIALPGLRRVLGVTPLGPLDVLVILLSAVIPLLVNETLKDRDLAAESNND